MSKTKDLPDEEKSGEHDNLNDQNNQKDGDKKPPEPQHEFPTIEEHAATLSVSAPIFAGVMQCKKWASGKRVPLTDFKQAVKDFSGASMGGE